MLLAKLERREMTSSSLFPQTKTQMEATSVGGKAGCILSLLYSGIEYFGMFVKERTKRGKENLSSEYF